MTEAAEAPRQYVIFSFRCEACGLYCERFMPPRTGLCYECRRYAIPPESSAFHVAHETSPYAGATDRKMDDLEDGLSMHADALGLELVRDDDMDLSAND